jgi:hypothetical protein
MKKIILTCLAGTLSLCFAPKLKAQALPEITSFAVDYEVAADTTLPNYDEDVAPLKANITATLSGTQGIAGVSVWFGTDPGSSNLYFAKCLTAQQCGLQWTINGNTLTLQTPKFDNAAQVFATLVLIYPDGNESTMARN